MVDDGVKTCLEMAPANPAEGEKGKRGGGCVGIFHS